MGKFAKKEKATHRFTQDSAEFKFLMKLMCQDKIKPDDRPNDIRVRYKPFNKYTSDQFRSQFNRVKGLTGLGTQADVKEKLNAENNVEGQDEDLTCDDMLENEVEEDEMDDDCAAYLAQAGRSRDNSNKVSSLKNATKVAPAGVTVALNLSGNWVPHKIVAEWKNEDGVDHVTVLIALTGGTACASTEGIEVFTQNDGHVLVVTEAWTDYMQDIDSFYRHFPTADDETEEDKDAFFRRRIAMKDAVRNLAEHCPGQGLTSVHKCALPFRIDNSEINYTIHGDKNGGRYVHIDLATRTRVKVRKVNIMEETVNDSVPSSAKKAKRYGGGAY